MRERLTALALAGLLLAAMVMTVGAAAPGIVLPPPAQTPWPEENAVTLDGEAAEMAEYVYSYAPEYGHVFGVGFSAGGEAWTILAALPEELCVSGAVYSGDDIADSGVVFEATVVDMESFAIQSYNSLTDPEAFEDLSVSFGSVTLYETARFCLAGTVPANGRDAGIWVLGEAAYTESAASTAAGTANVCGACGGSGKCAICHGSGVCQVCFGRGGMSVATYGMGGDDWVECMGCHGDRQCKYCNRGLCSACGGSGTA